MMYLDKYIYIYIHVYVHVYVLYMYMLHMGRATRIAIVRRAFYKAFRNTSHNTFRKSSLRFVRDADQRILASCAHGGVSAKGFAKNYLNMNE